MEKILKGDVVRDEILKSIGGGKTLGVIKFGNDPGAESYLKGIKKTAEKIGDSVVVAQLSTEEDSISVSRKISELKTMVGGILLLKPFPEGVSLEKMIMDIGPEKDVEGLHPENLGMLFTEPKVVPPTAGSVIELLKFYNIRTSGKRVVVLGRSEVVGKPLAMLLLQKGMFGDASVTVCHSKTEMLKDITKEADILIVSIGKPKFVKKDFISKGAIVIDVGINEYEGKIVGDVDYDDVFEDVSGITPVPNGVGKITSALIFKNLHNL